MSQLIVEESYWKY